MFSTARSLMHMTQTGGLALLRFLKLSLLLSRLLEQASMEGVVDTTTWLMKEA